MTKKNKIVIDPRDFPDPRQLLTHIKQYNDTHIVIAHPQEFAPVVEHVWKKPSFRRAVRQRLEENNLHVEYWLGTLEPDPFPPLEKSGIETKSWPMYWAYRTKEHIMYKTFDPHAPKNRLFVSLNNRGRNHRCMLIDKIFQRGLDQHSYLTWNDLDSFAENYEFEHFHGDQINLTEPNNPDGHRPYHQYLPPKEYCKAVFSLISESTVRYQDISEKTFIAIFYQQPFVIQGHPGIHQNLQEYGFELYDEYIDYAFDCEADSEKRTDMLLDQLEKYCDADYEHMADSMRSKARRNYQTLESIVNSRKHIPEEILEHMPDIGCVMPRYMIEQPEQFGL